MHRTQIILEDWQHQVLRARAEQEGRSMSDLVRELLGEALAGPPRGRGALDAIEGIAEDPAVSGGGHDDVLYGGADRR